MSDVIYEPCWHMSSRRGRTRRVALVREPSWRACPSESSERTLSRTWHTSEDGSWHGPSLSRRIFPLELITEFSELTGSLVHRLMTVLGLFQGTLCSYQYQMWVEK